MNIERAPGNERERPAHETEEPVEPMNALGRAVARYKFKDAIERLMDRIRGGGTE